jgi:hypothetical protein
MIAIWPLSDKFAQKEQGKIRPIDYQENRCVWLSLSAIQILAVRLRMSKFPPRAVEAGKFHSSMFLSLLTYNAEERGGGGHPNLHFICWD